MSIVENFRFHVDFASNYRLSGWALDLENRGRPTTLCLRRGDGTSHDLSRAIHIPRIDVCEAFDLPAETATGFEANLLEIFNDRCYDYTLCINGMEIWSYNHFLAEVDQKPQLPPPSPFVNEYGMCQVVIIYANDGWLHKNLQRIHNWNPVHFRKGYQSGVSFLFLDVEKLAMSKDGLLRSAAHGILIVDRQIFRAVFNCSPTLTSTWPIIVLDKCIDLGRDFSGLLSCLCALSGLPNHAELTPSRLVELLTALSGYKDLLFDQESTLYSFQSGTPQPWMGECMRQDVQDRATEDVVVLSERPLQRLADARAESCAVFVRTSALRFLLDVLDREPKDLLQAAYRRGLRVRTLTGEEA